MKRLTTILICCTFLFGFQAVGQTSSNTSNSVIQETVSKNEHKVDSLLKSLGRFNNGLDSLCREVHDLRRQESFRDDAAEKAQATIDRTVNVQTWIIGIVAFIITCLSAAGYLSTRRRLREIDTDFAKRTKRMDDFEAKLDDFDGRVNKTMERISSEERALSEQRKAYSEVLEKGEKQVIQIAKLRENAEREVDELRSKIPDISMTEKPSPQLEKQLDELTQKLRKLESLGGELSAEEYFQRGLDQYHKNLYEMALISFEHAIEVKSDYAEAWTGKGVTLRAMHRYEEALAAHEKAIEIKPDYVLAWTNKGAALGALQRNEESLAALAKAIDYEEDYAGAWYNKGVVLDALKRDEDAITAYDKAIEHKPDYANAWHNKGVTLGKLNRPLEEQLTAFEKAIEFKPDFAEAWSSKGVVLNEMGCPDEALESCTMAIRFKPNFASALYNRACLYVLRNDRDRALANLREAIVLDATFKEKAKSDEDFKSLWEDDDFKKLVGD